MYLHQKGSKNNLDKMGTRTEEHWTRNGNSEERKSCSAMILEGTWNGLQRGILTSFKEFTITYDVFISVYVAIEESVS